MSSLIAPVKTRSRASRMIIDMIRLGTLDITDPASAADNLHATIINMLPSWPANSDKQFWLDRVLWFVEQHRQYKKMRQFEKHVAKRSRDAPWEDLRARYLEKKEEMREIREEVGELGKKFPLLIAGLEGEDKAAARLEVLLDQAAEIEASVQDVSFLFGGMTLGGGM